MTKQEIIAYPVISSSEGFFSSNTNELMSDAMRAVDIKIKTKNEIFQMEYDAAFPGRDRFIFSTLLLLKMKLAIFSKPVEISVLKMNPKQDATVSATVVSAIA